MQAIPEPAPDPAVPEPVHPEIRPNKKRNRGTTRLLLVVLIAMTCGAALQWGGAKVTTKWSQAAEDEAILDAALGDPELPAEVAARENEPPVRIAAPDTIATEPPASRKKVYPRSQVASINLPGAELMPLQRGSPAFSNSVAQPDPKLSALSEEAQSVPAPQEDQSPPTDQVEAVVVETPVVEDAIVDAAVIQDAVVEDPVVQDAVAEDAAAPDAVIDDAEVAKAEVENLPDEPQVSLVALNPDPPVSTIAEPALPDEVLPDSRPELDIEVALIVPTRVSEDARNVALKVLADGEANVVASARVGYSVKETQVRFYHPNDAEMAALTAKALGAISRDFTDSNVKTRPGRIEVYLAGRGGGSSKSDGDEKQTRFDQFIARLLGGAN